MNLTFERNMPVLKPYRVAERIRRIKKPRTRIEGDIFPSLMKEYADVIAIPLTEMYNTITETLTWASCWKVEIVTVIPKCGDPTSFDQLRNISCTLHVSCLLYTSPSPRD